jgi:hypothetical protein
MNKTNMKILNFLASATVAASVLFLNSCTKESSSISTPQFKTGTTITSDTLTGSVKGTMLTGKTYYFRGEVTVNAGDTLVMQSGVKLFSKTPNSVLLINGVFISLGTKSSPNWITSEDAYKNPSTYKQTTYVDPNTDKGLCLTCLNNVGKLWGGIQCSTTATLVDIKWTHLDFVGGTAASGSTVVTSTSFAAAYKSGDLLFAILFQNFNGNLIIEDSWFYGTSTDVARIKGGKIHIMRNTVEKMGYNDGDAFNVKGGSVGDMAYNLIIGTAKGGTKASNKGQAVGAPQTFINMYNNTYINEGWRSLDPDRGANVDIEEGARGYAYNNIIVNCRTGIRFLENPKADTTNVVISTGDSGYGNNLSYGDSVSVTGQFLASSHLAKFNTTDLPVPSSYYTNPKNGQNGKYWFVVAGQAQPAAGAPTANGYDGATLVGKNSPKFVNFPLPTTAAHLRDITWADGWDFHLAAGSPAIGKGTATALTPLNATASVSNKYLTATVTPPNKDMGAFPTDGTGNQH